MNNNNSDNNERRIMYVPRKKFKPKRFDRKFEEFEYHCFNQKYLINKFESFVKNKNSESSFQYFQVLSSYKFIKTFQSLS